MWRQRLLQLLLMLAWTFVAAPVYARGVTAELGSPVHTRPTRQPTLQSGLAKRACYQQMCLSYDPAMAGNVTASLIPAQEFIGPEQVGAPEHVRFQFDGYPIQTTWGGPRLEIFPVAKYVAGNYPYGAASNFSQLQGLLARRPSLHPYVFNLAQSTPLILPELLPPNNASRWLALKQAYIDFGNGSGVRSISSFTQESAVLTRDERLFYPGA